MISFSGPRSKSIDALVADRVATRLAKRDSTLWGEAAAAEASVRLGWVDAPTRSRALKFPEPVENVVLAGMGGSSLAPEIFAKSFGKKLTVIDSVDPDQVARSFANPDSLVIVASKSGGTVETLSQRKYAEELGREIVVITDPGSALSDWAMRSSLELFHADPHVGGRFSAFTAFGLVPAAYLGIDVDALITEATAALDLLLRDDESNPALLLGALLGDQAKSGVDKLVIVDHNGLGDWIEQLVAESTGKGGKGILPVVISPDEIRELPSDCLITHCGAESSGEVSIHGSIPELMVLWQVATVVACRIIGVNPFDQPDVELAKQAARDHIGKSEEPRFVENGVAVYPSFKTSAKTLVGILEDFFSLVGPKNYLAVQAFVDREEHKDLSKIQTALLNRLNRPVTFGWGPRYLHSTGQIHKGGPRTGVFLQIINHSEKDVAIPGEEFSFGELIKAQAIGDAHVLGDLGMPVLRLHFTNQSADMAFLVNLLK